MSAAQRLVLASVAADASERLRELTDRVVGLLIAREAAYAEVSADDLRRSVSANYSGSFQVMTGGLRAGPDDLVAPSMTGRRRARQNVPLESMLHAYHLGGQALTEAMLAVAQRRSPQEPIVCLGVAKATMTVSDWFFQAALEGYQQTATDLRRYDSPRPREMFDALLDGQGVATSVVGEAASVLALPATGPYVVVVCTVDPSADRRQALVRDICAVHGLPAAWRVRADREIGIVALGASTATRLVDKLRLDASGRIGISSTFESLHEVPVAHRLAELAIATMRPDRPEVAWIDDRLPESLVVASPDLAARLARRALGRVLDLPQPERDTLLETLNAWYDSNSASAAAGALSCHRNTVLSRLHRVETLTGRSLTDHRDLLACHLALLTLRLQPIQNP